MHVDRDSANRRRTSRLLCFLPQSLLKRLLILQRLELLTFALRVSFGIVVLGQDTVALRVEDDECLDRIKREVHLVVGYRLDTEANEGICADTTLDTSPHATAQ